MKIYLFRHKRILRLVQCSVKKLGLLDCSIEQTQVCSFNKTRFSCDRNVEIFNRKCICPPVSRALLHGEKYNEFAAPACETAEITVKLRTVRWNGSPRFLNNWETRVPVEESGYNGWDFKWIYLFIVRVFCPFIVHTSWIVALATHI